MDSGSVITLQNARSRCSSESRSPIASGNIDKVLFHPRHNSLSHFKLEIEFGTSDKKKVLFNALKKAQGLVADTIYAEYLRLVSEQMDIIENGLKKN